MQNIYIYKVISGQQGKVKGLLVAMLFGWSTQDNVIVACWSWPWLRVQPACVGLTLTEYFRLRIFLAI